MPEPAAIMVPVASLVPWAANPRDNDGPPVAAIVESIRRFGFGTPVLARKENGEIIAGHTRVKAALAMGLAEVPVRYMDLTAEEAHALALADNKIGELSTWNSDGLVSVMADLRDAGTEIGGLGWSDVEVYNMLADGERPAENGDDEDETPLPLPAEPVSRLGEVYQLGPHRLVCGSSTDAAAWEALLGEERLQMVWTDPPYGVSIVGGNHSLPPEERKKRGGKVIENDALTPDQLRQFLTDALGMTMAHLQPGGALYAAAPPGPLHNIFGDVLIALDVWKRSLVWVKDVFVMGRGDQHYRHEPIFYGWAPGAAHYWCGRRDIDTIFEVPRPKRSKDHPTMKPVALVRQHIEHSSQKGWIVGEPFGGSGTTLIAADVAGRIARLIELDPGYCDVIRQRWTRWAKARGVDPGPGALEG